LERRDTDFTRLIQSCVDDAKGEATLRGLTLEIALPKESIAASVDPDRVRLVLSNIIGNALKFTTAGTIFVRSFRSGDRCGVEVKDSGAGIPRDELPFFFDRLYQGRIGRGRKGSGLGLAIAKAWVEAHGGKIWAESEGVGKGATITFTVPVK